MTVFLFFKIFLICLIGAISPGPSMALVINNSIFKNKYNGILTAIGHGLGISIYAIFAVIGIGLVIKTNIFIYNTLKVLSIFFLLFMGFKSIKSKNKFEFNKDKFKKNSISFFEGFLISILNPKILIWFLAIYSQFMSPGNNLILNISLILIAGTVDTLWYVFLVNIVTRKNILNLIKQKSDKFEFIIGCIFILISLMLFVDLIYEF